MAVGREVCVAPGHIVLDGDPASLPKKRGRAPPPIFGPFCCGQTTGCIKLPIGDCVLDGDPAPSPKVAEPPVFVPRLLWPNGCMDQDATWYGGFGLRDIVLDGDSASTSVETKDVASVREPRTRSASNKNDILFSINANPPCYIVIAYALQVSSLSSRCCMTSKQQRCVLMFPRCKIHISV